MRRSATSTWGCSGLGLSFQYSTIAPDGICSKPSAKAISTAPLATACRARYSALAPLEQLLLMLNMGIPVIPTPYIARCPLQLSP